MGDYGLRMCRIQSEYAQLDDTVDKKLWLKEQLNQLEKIYHNDIKLLWLEFSFAYKGLMNLLDKGDK